MANKIPCPADGCDRELDRRGLPMHLANTHGWTAAQVAAWKGATAGSPPGTPKGDLDPQKGGDADGVSPFRRSADSLDDDLGI